jgi:hypothetical protein
MRTNRTCVRIRRIGAVAVAAALAAFTAPNEAIRAEEPANPVAVQKDEHADHQPDQKPVGGWLTEITNRQSKVQSLVASYEIQEMTRGRKKPLIEKGTVKFRFPAEPGADPQERWEGTSETNKVRRIVRDGKAYTWVNDKVTLLNVRDRNQVCSSTLRFPLLPQNGATRFFIWHATEFEPGRTDPTPANPFPTALCFEPRAADDTHFILQRAYMALDAQVGVVYRLRLQHRGGGYVELELFERKVNAPVTDADFAAPKGVAGAEPKDNKPGGKRP